MSEQSAFRKRSSDEVREDIKSRSRSIDQEYLRLGKDLYVAKHCEFYLKWGFATWREFVETEANMSIKRDERLRKVWKTLVKGLGVTPSDLHDIGFSKASLLCKDGLLTRQNLKDWLKKARESSFRDLEKATKGKSRKVTTREETTTTRDEETGEEKTETREVRTVETDDGNVDFDSLKFSVTSEQREVIDEALAKAERMAESDKKGHLLHLICTDFLAGALGEDPEEKSRLRFHLANLEKAFGVNIMALPETDEAAQAIKEFVDSRPDLFALVEDDGDEDEGDEEE